MIKRKKSKKYLLAENLDNITSFEQLNETQKEARRRLLLVIAYNEEDFVRLDKEFDINRTKEFLYEAVYGKLDLLGIIDVYSWRLKVRIKQIFYRLKYKNRKRHK